MDLSEHDAVVRTTARLAALDTGVPAGATRPDPQVVADHVRASVLPMLRALRPDEVREHAHGDVAVRIGPDRDDGVVLIAYIVAQHGNPEDRRVEVRDGYLIGRGVAQCKGAMGAALDALARVDRTALRRPVWLCVNTEGSSSHGGSQRLLGDLGVTGRCAVVLTGTDLDVSICNRGRADLRVELVGRGGHSSRPEDLANPFDALGSVLDGVARLAPPIDHPVFGPASVTVFAMDADPVAPHTVPDRLTLTVDRRLLPGETPQAALDAARAVLEGRRGQVTVAVTPGAWMLPAEVAPDEPVVRALLAGVRRPGRDAAPVASRHTFDAGWACSLGMPTPMFGPGRRAFGHDVTAAESVAVEDLVTARDALAHAVPALCSSP
jgi:succinyl-diaminopimelate desuccinylase